MPTFLRSFCSTVMLSLKMEKGPHKVGAELVQGVLFMDAQDMDRK